jgi:hypothetical protein
MGTKADILPIKTNLEMKSLQSEVDRHMAYIKAIDPVIEPIVNFSRNTLHKDGFIPGFILVKMLRLAEERANQPKATFKNCLSYWVNLAIFGDRR